MSGLLLLGAEAEVRLVLAITRKDTGAVEMVEMVGRALPAEPVMEERDVRDAS